MQVDCAFPCCSLPSSPQNPQKSGTPYAMVSSYDVDELGDFLLEEGIPGDIVTSFTGTLTWFSWMYMYYRGPVSFPLPTLATSFPFVADNQRQK